MALIFLRSARYYRKRGAINFHLSAQVAVHFHYRNNATMTGVIRQNAHLPLPLPTAPKLSRISLSSVAKNTSHFTLARSGRPERERDRAPPASSRPPPPHPRRRTPLPAHGESRPPTLPRQSHVAWPAASHPPSALNWTDSCPFRGISLFIWAFLELCRPRSRDWRLRRRREGGGRAAGFLALRLIWPAGGLRFGGGGGGAGSDLRRAVKPVILWTFSAPTVFVLLCS
jgi:hypothetical protein